MLKQPLFRAVLTANNISRSWQRIQSLQPRSPVRQMGIFSKLKEAIKEEAAKNPELQKSIDELRQNQSLQDTAKRAKEAAEKLQTEAQKAAMAAAIQAEKVKAQAAEAKKEAEKLAEDMRSELHEDTNKNASQHDMDHEGEPMRGDTTKTAGENDVRQPLADKFEHPILKSFAEGFDELIAGKKKEFVPASYEAREKAAAEAIEREKAAVEAAAESQTTDAVVPVVERKSWWDEQFQRSPLLGRIFAGIRGVFGLSNSVAGGAADRVFGENEHALALEEVLERDPEFLIEAFLDHVKLVTIPKVMAAYLQGDPKTVRIYTRDQAYAFLNTSIRERQASGIIMDPRILELDRIEFADARLLNENDPVLLVSFVTQQINCIRDRSGKIIEGAEDDIRSIFYIFALARNESEGVTLHCEDAWQVVELAIQGGIKNSF